VSEYEGRLEAAEEEARKRAKTFDPAELLRSSREPRTIHDPELGEVRYGALTIRDLLEIRRETEDPGEQALRMLHRMLRKAYPDLTLEDVNDLPYDAALRLLDATGRAMGFTPHSTRSMIGSDAALRPRQ
jgi:hypothetical protein